MKFCDLILSLRKIIAFYYVFWEFYRVHFYEFWVVLLTQCRHTLYLKMLKKNFQNRRYFYLRKYWPEFVNFLLIQKWTKNDLILKLWLLSKRKRKRLFLTWFIWKTDKVTRLTKNSNITILSKIGTYLSFISNRTLTFGMVF